MLKKITDITSLGGNLLVATPALDSTCFERAVIYVCAHNQSGAMGIIINQALSNMTCGDILKQVGINNDGINCRQPVYFGGPVESSKGFILHTNDYFTTETQKFADNISVTSTVKILKDITCGKGPSQSIIALGYAGWSEGQIEKEVISDSWIVLPADEALIFKTDVPFKWREAARVSGFDINMYSKVAGNA